MTAIEAFEKLAREFFGKGEEALSRKIKTPSYTNSVVLDTAYKTYIEAARMAREALASVKAEEEGKCACSKESHEPRRI